MTRGRSHLYLVSDWIAGATILAGTGVRREPVPAPPTTWIECPDCPTLVLGATETAAASRLARHRARNHG